MDFFTGGEYYYWPKNSLYKILKKKTWLFKKPTSVSKSKGVVMKALFFLSVLFSPLFSYSGPCANPEDRDSAGRRCGKRAASVRPGGELGGDGTYNRPIEKTSNIIEKPQWTQRRQANRQQRFEKTSNIRKSPKRKERTQGRQANRQQRFISSIGGGWGIKQDKQLKTVLAVFKRNKDQWFTVKDIRDNLNKNWPVEGLLDHLSKKGELIKDPDGKGFKYSRFLMVFQ